MIASGGRSERKAIAVAGGQRTRVENGGRRRGPSTLSDRGHGINEGMGRIKRHSADG